MRACSAVHLTLSPLSLNMTPSAPAFFSFSRAVPGRRAGMRLTGGPRSALRSRTGDTAVTVCQPAPTSCCVCLLQLLGCRVRVVAVEGVSHDRGIVAVERVKDGHQHYSDLVGQRIT